ncbi:hypothetical protein DO021_15570 [Desulfobacter hydrogenophilus]|uniref:NACHT domain-containing protein n=1 Tax=Desulfobacter hydrogenophilus TaxID=2291 RepID=A0A328FDH0_9BACT|nr:hypothetical protein [Desulfobacter hydrogenophilus]NDY73101.1 hypothetical protein [Desulfobacter hydrogenophilus]QBH13552.1 hypothetical protein EYB58_11820 [Desulfobacter hydrogenophilus]RAM01105.1 hypothetical protein DO021_15570 [Desulfobacter hydrogenophilus]
MTENLKSWGTLERNVRTIASFKWNRNCIPEQISGVNIDAVVKLEHDYYILVEVTERKSLTKTREDINKLIMAKASLFTKSIFAKCYCVTLDNPTPAMQNAGKENSIEVMSYKNFVKDFYDFESYNHIRKQRPFGSSYNPYTGEVDRTTYIPVHYYSKTLKKDLTIDEIIKKLQSGKKIILLGDYGTGKSRCIRELFFLLCKTSKASKVYPLAIDLRENWGLNSGAEIIRRHFQELGLEKIADNVIKSYREIPFCFMLDGFDEIGSQAWNESPSKLSLIRKKSLEGVRHLITNVNHGMLISGRKHYFNTDHEMHESLGTSPDQVEIIQCYDEFTDDEMVAFLNKLSNSIILPDWLPRRPLICQVIITFDDLTIEQLLSSNENIFGFWKLFIDAVTKRESNIRSALDPTSIKSILKKIARRTRLKPGVVGPITQTEINAAFEEVVGTPPIGESAIVLQRLPGLGRVKSESDERQFIDIFILDGLWAEDIIDAVNSFDKTILSDNWKNPLKKVGLEIVATEINGNGNGDSKISFYIEYLKEACESNNIILSCDLIASIILGCANGKKIDFPDIKLSDGHFSLLDFSDSHVENITFKECIIEEFYLPKKKLKNINLIDCTINQLYGISSDASLPNWVESCLIENFEAVDTVSRIKKANLSIPQRIFITIIRKTFFQPGSARKEEALLRGLGLIDRKGFTKKIVNLLIRENIIEKDKGKEGYLYIPNRSEVARMKSILDDLKHSKDKLWQRISNME